MSTSRRRRRQITRRGNPGKGSKLDRALRGLVERTDKILQQIPLHDGSCPNCGNNEFHAMTCCEECGNENWSDRRCTPD